MHSPLGTCAVVMESSILAFAFQLNGYIESKRLSRACTFSRAPKNVIEAELSESSQTFTKHFERLELVLTVRPPNEKLHNHLCGTDVKVNSTNRKIWPAREEKHLTEPENAKNISLWLACCFPFISTMHTYAHMPVL